jgi:ribosome-associated protein
MGLIPLGRGVSVDERELEWRFSPSGGPGGQHANRSATRADLRLDLTGSPSLSDEQRERLVGALGPEVRISVDETRSQARNRELAVERLRERVAEALRPRRRRRPTAPSKGAVERRLREKQQRSSVKRQRGRPGADE